MLGPGEPIGMYHWEADQEDFLVLSGEALLIVEGHGNSKHAGETVAQVLESDPDYLLYALNISPNAKLKAAITTYLAAVVAQGLPVEVAHCPPETRHMIVGAGTGLWAVLAVGAREHQAGTGWGGYTVDEVAARHGASVERETTGAVEAYARFPEPVPTPYREGWLPIGSAE